MSDLPDYTPGPWRYEKYDGNHESAIIGGCYQIATVYYDDAGSNANARLIAASPDLLAACKAAVDRFDYLRNLWGDEAITKRLCDQLRAAIAAAEGVA